MITYEIFENYMHKYLEVFNEATLWWDDLEKVFGSGAWEKAIQHSAFTFFLKFVEEAMNDTEHWLCYWAYENEHKFPFTYYENDKECTANNFKDLYNLIMIKPLS